MGSFVIMGISMSRTIGPTDFELNRFIIRIGYLAMVGVLLVYLGRHESQLRDEIRQLALWPSPVDGNDDEAVSGMLKYACGLMLAHRAVLVWTPEEEPRTELALWSHRGLERRRLAPDAVDPAGPATLAESSWISKDSLSAHGDIDTLVDDKAGRWTGLPVHEALATLIGEGPVASAPFRTEQLAGRVFFVDVEVPRVESLALLAAVARQVGMSLDRLASIRRQRVLDVGDERNRVAQDLHDGVLQSLTGVRLELQRVAGGLPPVEAESRNRLLTLERALALEQRELRLFIEDLKPFVRPAAEGSLVDRLDSLRRRLSEQWNVPIAVRVDARVSLDRAADEAMVPLVNEAIVNALKHAHPSRVSVDVVRDGDQTRVTVVDDGRGFAFAGRLEHEALAASGLGPVSLRERMAALGGRLNIESSTAGSRLDLLIPAGAHPGRG